MNEPGLAGYLRTYTNSDAMYCVEIQDMYGSFTGVDRRLRDPSGKGLFSLGVMKMREFGGAPKVGWDA